MTSSWDTKCFGMIISLFYSLIWRVRFRWLSSLWTVSCVMLVPLWSGILGVLSHIGLMPRCQYNRWPTGMLLVFCGPAFLAGAHSIFVPWVFICFCPCKYEQELLLFLTSGHGGQRVSYLFHNPLLGLTYSIPSFTHFLSDLNYSHELNGFLPLNVRYKSTNWIN